MGDLKNSLSKKFESKKLIAITAERNNSIVLYDLDYETPELLIKYAFGKKTRSCLVIH